MFLKCLLISNGSLFVVCMRTKYKNTVLNFRLNRELQNLFSSYITSSYHGEFFFVNKKTTANGSHTTLGFFKKTQKIRVNTNGNRVDVHHEIFCGHETKLKFFKKKTQSKQLLFELPTRTVFKKKNCLRSAITYSVLINTRRTTNVYSNFPFSWPPRVGRPSRVRGT